MMEPTTNRPAFHGDEEDNIDTDLEPLLDVSHIKGGEVNKTREDNAEPDEDEAIEEYPASELGLDEEWIDEE